MFDAITTTISSTKAIEEYGKSMDHIYWISNRKDG